jgi:hypothetical protein
MITDDEERGERGGVRDVISPHTGSPDRDRIS